MATIAQLPFMRFTNVIGGVKKPYHFTTPPRDTVGMYAPFDISYHGVTVNGRVRGYQYFPLSTAIIIPGAGLWYDDVTDTLRSFPNTVADHLPAGSFRFAAKCVDDAGAESQVDASNFGAGGAHGRGGCPGGKVCDAKPRSLNRSVGFHRARGRVCGGAWVKWQMQVHHIRGLD